MRSENLRGLQQAWNFGEDLSGYDEMLFQIYSWEHKESYGTYAFDREWWTVRQISTQLFRIGELEYELVEDADKRYISLHIPSDAILQEEEIGKSYWKAKKLVKEAFPEYSAAKIICRSWLLSPALKEALHEGSHILAFQKLFDIELTGKEETEYIQWVFKNPKLAPADYPEQTSLQRNLKKYLLSGGTVMEAEGRLRERLFAGVCEKKEILETQENNS